MPVVPSFSGYAPTPDLAQAYLGGQELQLGRDRLRQQAAADSARISLGYAELQQRAVANEMELAAKKELLSRQALKTAQEQEIEKAYRETQLGLRQRELQNEEALAQMRIQEATRDFDRQMGYRNLVQKYAPTMGLEEAARRAALELGGTGFSTALERPQAASPFPELNFRMKQLDEEEESIMRKYPGMTGMAIRPEDQAKLADIDRRKRELEVPSSLRSNTSTNAPSGTNAPKTIRVVRDANGKLVIQRSTSGP